MNACNFPKRVLLVLQPQIHDSWHQVTIQDKVLDLVLDALLRGNATLNRCLGGVFRRLDLHGTDFPIYVSLNIPVLDSREVGKR